MTKSAALACPVCNHQESQHLLNIKHGLDMSRCESCGLIFAVPIWKEAIFSEDWPEGISIHGSPSNRHEAFDSIAKIITERNPNGGRLLDIGCAEGLFFQAMTRHSQAWDLWGLEPDPKWQEHNYGTAKVKPLLLREAHLPEQSFDVITILDAFWYIPEPEKELAEIARLLKPNAYLLLDIPGQFYLKLRGWLGGLAKMKNTKTFSAYPFYYSDKAMKQLLQQSGLTVADTLASRGTAQRSRPLYWLMGLYLGLVSLFHKITGRGIAAFPKAIYIIKVQK